jgi:excisionase family DNA binding protein
MINSKFSINLLTSDEVCSILNISKRSLQNYRDKRIISFVQCGRKILYTEDGLKAFLEAHHIKSPNLKEGKQC